MVDVADAAVVAILTRAPAYGGKSRLFAGLHRPPDPELLSALLLDTLAGTAVPGVIRVVAVEPPHACEDVRALVGNEVRVVPQTSGSLGDRMRAVMADLFEQGARAVLLIGSDLPGIERRTLSKAFALLEADPALLVLGPATDGGYYLVGASGRVPRVFDGIEWGTGRVMAQTVAAAGRQALNVALLDPLPDVDTVDDLRAVSAPLTRAWVRAHLGHE